MNNLYLIVKETDPSEIALLTVHMLEGDTIDHAGFKCKVASIEIQEEGSKQWGNHSFIAKAHLRLINSYEID